MFSICTVKKIVQSFKTALYTVVKRNTVKNETYFYFVVTYKLASYDRKFYKFLTKSLERSGDMPNIPFIVTEI